MTVDHRLPELASLLATHLRFVLGNKYVLAKVNQSHIEVGWYYQGDEVIIFEVHLKVNNEWMVVERNGKAKNNILLTEHLPVVLKCLADHMYNDRLASCLHSFGYDVDDIYSNNDSDKGDDV